MRIVFGTRRADWREVRREGSRGWVGVRGMRMGVGVVEVVGIEVGGWLLRMFFVGWLLLGW